VSSSRALRKIPSCVERDKELVSCLCMVRDKHSVVIFSDRSNEFLGESRIGDRTEFIVGKTHETLTRTVERTKRAA
jgi:hypothetical protein